MKQHPNYNASIQNFNYIEVQEQLKHLHSRCVTYRIQHPELFKRSYQEELIKLDTAKEYLNNSLSSVIKDIHDVTLEIEQFERMSSELSEDKIRDYETTINHLNNEIAQITVDDTLPILNAELIRDIDLDLLKNNLLQIHSAGTSVLTRDMYNELLSETNVLKSRESSITRELAQVVSALKNTQSRLSKFKLAEFREGCVLACPAREKYSDAIASLEQEELLILTSIEEYESSLIQLAHDINNNTDRLNEASPNVQLVSYVEGVLDTLKLYEYIVEEDTFIMALVQNPMGIYNTLYRIIKNSEQFCIRFTLKLNLEEIEARLLSLLETKKETVGMMGVSITTKRSSLTVLNEQYSNIKHKLNTIEDDMLLYRDIQLISGSVEVNKKYCDDNIVAHVINKKIELLESVLKDIVEYKKIVEDEQLSIKATIKEKESIKIRLEEEILPSLSNLTAECERLEQIEKALNPTSGIPHVYMVRFMNNIITKVNTIIGQVWNYDMELILLKESKTLDFDFEVKLYGNNPPLKDIGLLSKGQKEMVNLAFTIALFIIMKLGNKYPIKLDEVDGALSAHHREKLLTLLSGLIHTEDIKQMFLVNHFHTLFSSFANAQIICLNNDGIILPTSYNEGVIKK